MSAALSPKEEKARIREAVWRLLEERGVARFPRPVHGRIPNFAGAEEAAARLAQLPAWRRARLVKVNPDSPQKPVRLLALRQGKILVMASPRLRSGFILVDPRRIPPYLYEKASTIRGAFELGRQVSLDELRSLGPL
ncbi:MAG: 5-formyltetrahydrofolate cyclo-ligase, partial [Thermoproteota archaeon]